METEQLIPHTFKQVFCHSKIISTDNINKDEVEPGGGVESFIKRVKSTVKKFLNKAEKEGNSSLIIIISTFTL